MRLCCYQQSDQACKACCERSGTMTLSHPVSLLFQRYPHFVQLATVALTLATLISVSSGQYTPEAEADRVTALPGTEELKSDLFSGCASACLSHQSLFEGQTTCRVCPATSSTRPCRDCSTSAGMRILLCLLCEAESCASRYITVDKEAGRALYYIFVEAEDPASAPLALWLSG